MRTRLLVASASALVAVLALAPPCRVLAAPEPDAGGNAALRKLAAARDKLVAELDARAEADRTTEAPLDCSCLLPGGADGEDMWMILHRRGGKWHPGEVRVPYWRQETQSEKFSFQHRDGGSANDRDKFLHTVDASELKWDGTRLTGKASVSFLRDRTMDEMLPPGGRSFMTAQGRWSLMDRWGTILHRKVRPQTYTFDVSVSTNVSFLQLVIDQGIGSSPIFVDGQVPSSRWSAPHVTAPRFNAGYHEGWLDGLKQEGSRLKGEVRLRINPDVYWPRESIDITYTVDAEILNGRILGTFNAQVTALKDMHETITGQRYGKVGSWKGPTQFSGTVRGTILRGVEGRFTATGELGSCEGPVRGGVLSPTTTARETIARHAPPGESATAASLYQQTRALRLALDRYPLPLSDALADTALPLPAIPDDRQAQFAERLAATLSVATAPSPVAGYTRPDDATFGPYHGVKTMEERDGVAQWPKDATTDKVQPWRAVATWSALGPFPQNRTLDGETPMLPDLIPVAGATYPPVGLPGNVFSNRLAWASVTGANGRVSVPLWIPPGKSAQRGWYNSRWYAAAGIDMPSETEAWIAIETMDHGALWVNDRQVWVAAERELMNSDRGPAILKTTLKKGRNEFLVRCRDDRGDSWFSFAVCAGSQPGARPAPAEPPAQAEIPGQPGLNGFSYPKASPPLAWDLEKGINVLWRWKGTNLPRIGTTMVGAGGGGAPIAADDSPGKLIVVGDRVFLNQAPHILTCLNAANGELLWTRESSIFELLGGEAQKAWSSAANTAGQLAVFAAQAEAIGAKIAGYGRLASATPVSDGKRVFVHYATGVTAAYDIEGKRLWMHQTRVGAGSLLATPDRVIADRTSTGGSGITVGSMLVSQGRVILSGVPLAGWREKNAPDAKPPAAFHAVMAFDPETGRTLWSATARGTYTMAPFRVNCAGRELLVSRNGEVLDATDGRTCGPSIDPDFGSSFKWTGMYQRNNRFFMVEELGETCFDVLVNTDGQAGWRHNWIARRLFAYAAGGPNVGIPVDSDFIVWRRPQEFAKHNPQYSLGLDVYGAVDGVHNHRLSRILTNTNVPLPPVRGGDYLFLADLRGGPFTTFSNRPAEERMVAVVKLTPQPFVVAKNLTPGLYASPMPAGSRLFVRCENELVAIGVKGDDGRRYQEQAVMRTVLNDLPPPSAGSGMPKTLEPLPGKPAADVPVMPLSGQLMDWLVAGPFPGQAPGSEMPVAARRLDEVPANGADLTVGTMKRSFAPLDADAQDALTRFVNDGQLDDWQLRSLDRAVLVDKLPMDTPDDVYFFSAIVDNARDRIACATAEAPGIETFLDGVLAAPAIPLFLKQGRHHIALRVRPGHYRKPVFAASVHVPQALASNALQDIRWPAEWTVYGPVAESMSPPDEAQMKKVPASLSLDGTTIERKVLKADKGIVNLAELLQAGPDAKIDQTSVAYAFAEIECPEDGHFIVNASADWCMAWFLDGEPVYNTFAAGNRGPSDVVTGHTFVRQVKKGRHVLVAKVKPGSKGWSFISAGGFTPGDPVEIAQRFPAQGIVPAGKVIRVTPGLGVMENPAAVAATWRGQVQARRDIVEEAAKSPYPDLARQARSILKQAGM